jgi:hypothetical protein
MISPMFVGVEAVLTVMPSWLIAAAGPWPVESSVKIPGAAGTMGTENAVLV